jgi:hypothetical protein
MKFYDIFYLLYIAITQSLFVKVFFLIIIYVIQYLNTLPKKNWYGYDDDQKDFKCQDII